MQPRRTYASLGPLALLRSSHSRGFATNLVSKNQYLVYTSHPLTSWGLERPLTDVMITVPLRIGTKDLNSTNCRGNYHNINYAIVRLQYRRKKLYAESINEKSLFVHVTLPWQETKTKFIRNKPKKEKTIEMKEILYCNISAVKPVD